MAGLSFHELWDQSEAFRIMLISQRCFNAANRFDLGLAEALWDDRFPRIGWDFCQVDGCTCLVKAGERCIKHIHDVDNIPSFKWAKGYLYHYVTRNSHDKNRPVRRYYDYERNDLYVWRYNYGKVNPGYKIRQIDRNPFNHRIGNLFLLSRYIAPAYDADVINASEALKMDDVMPEVLRDRLGGGRRSGWVYGIDGIAKTAGIREGRVRQEISRGNLCPGDLSSVVDFCKRHQEKRILKMERMKNGR